MEPNVSTAEKKKMFQVAWQLLTVAAISHIVVTVKQYSFRVLQAWWLKFLKSHYKAGGSYGEKQLALISTSQVEIKWMESSLWCSVFHVMSLLFGWILLSFKDLQIWLN